MDPISDARGAIGCARRGAAQVLVAVALAAGSLAIGAAPASAAPPVTTMVPTSPPSVAVVGGTEVAAWRGSDGAVWTNSGNQPAPGTATSLGGLVVGAPDLGVSPDDSTTLVALGADGATWTRRREPSGGWGSWRSLGGRFQHPPTVASWSTGRLDVFGAGMDGALWHTSSNDGGRNWAGWESLGGQVTAAPDAAAPMANRLDIVVRGSDSSVWTRGWDGRGWTPWTNLGGRIEDGPAVAATSAADLVVFARGADGANYRQPRAGSWRGWSQASGRLRGDLDATPGAGGAIVAGLGLDGRLWTAGPDGQWRARSWADPMPPVDPYGSNEYLGVQYTDRITVSGWAVDAGTPAATVRVDLVVDGVVTGGDEADYWRAGLGSHAFSFTAPAAPGARAACTVARDQGAGDDVVLGCFSLTVPQPSGYAFMATQPRGHPVRFDRCRRVPIVFNPSGGPASARAELDAAVAELRAATGLDVFVEGTTVEPAVLARLSYNPVLYGERWAPVLVGFSNPTLTPTLAGGVAGLGGGVASRGPDGQVLVSGIVILDGPQTGTLATGWGEGATLRKLILHELTHVFGLSHVNDTAQIMNPSIPPRPGGYGAGDLAGLNWLGANQPCARMPAPGVPGVTSASVGDNPAPLPAPGTAVSGDVRRPG